MIVKGKEVVEVAKMPEWVKGFLRMLLEWLLTELSKEV